MSRPNHQLLQTVKWDIRIFIGLALVLAVLMTFSFAAPGSTNASFDFGGSALSDQASGMIPVKGSASPYPQTSGGLTFGWTDAGSVQIFSSPTVADKMRKDSNGGTTTNTFKLAGLGIGDYVLSATVGSQEDGFTTTMRVGTGVRSVVTSAGVWKVMSMPVTTTDGTLDVIFSGSTVWGVNGLSIAPGVSSNPASFTLGISPSSATVTAGEATSFQVSVTPLNDYDANVTLSASGLAGGISAELSPAQLTSLPGSSILRLTTEQSTPGAEYTILVNAIGDDPDKVTKTAITTLTVRAANTGTTTPDGDGDTTEPDVITEVDPAKIAADQALLDQFAVQQGEAVVNRENFAELVNIDTDIAGHIPDVVIPAPVTPFEGVLQRLTGSGIISMTADSAPIAQVASVKPLPWWRALVQVIFKPTE